MAKSEPRQSQIVPTLVRLYQTYHTKPISSIRLLFASLRWTAKEIGPIGHVETAYKVQSAKVAGIFHLVVVDVQNTARGSCPEEAAEESSSKDPQEWHVGVGVGVGVDQF